MYSFPYLELVCCSMSSSNCCFLTCIQISQEADQVVWYSHLLNFPQFVVIHTGKGCRLVNKAEVDVFLELSCFFMIQRMLAIWSLVSLPFLKPARTSGSSRFTYCWSLAWRILSITLLACQISMQLCSSLSILWHCLSLGLEWKRKNFSSPVATAEFSKCAGMLSTALSQHHLLGFEIAQLEFHHLH